MKAIVLIDHESNDLYIAEIEKDSDMKKIVEENEKLNEEQRENHERVDYYEQRDGKKRKEGLMGPDNGLCLEKEASVKQVWPRRLCSVWQIGKE